MLPASSSSRRRPRLLRALCHALGLCLVSSLAFTPATAQVTGAVDSNALRTGSIHGSFSSLESRSKPLSNVVVTLVQTGDMTSVDKAGNYHFPALQPGTYTLVASGEGYSRLRVTDVVVRPGTDTTLSLMEMPTVMKDGEVQTMQEVVVSARKDVETMDRYVVEDSRPKPFTDRNVDIPRTINDAQPYYIMDAKTIEQSGALNVEDFLKQRLTMNTSAINNNQYYSGETNNLAIGGASNNVSSINLRGLGANETLILINGRRAAGVVFNDTNAGAQPDINGIPLAAIDRIEVLPASSSAIYGGSALGGVINIVLKKDYQGGEIRATYENTAGTDAPIRNASLTYGFSLEGGKTRVMLSASYSDMKPMLLQDRIFLQREGLATILKNNPTYIYTPTIPYRGSTPNIISRQRPTQIINGQTAFSNLVLKDGTPLNSPFTYIDLGTSPTTPLATLYASLLANAGKYNLTNPPGTGQNGLLNQIGTPVESKSFMASIHREMNTKLELFVEFSNNTNAADSFYNPIGIIQIPSTNPFNPFRNNIALTLPSTIKRPNGTNSILLNVTTGAIFKLPFDWSGELDYTWSQSRYRAQSWLLDPAIGSVNDIGPFNPVTPTANPFVDTLANPPSIDSYFYPSSNSTSATVNDLALRASGPLMHLSWGNPTLTVGLEHRKEGYPNVQNDVTFDSNYRYYVTSSGYNIYYGQSQTTDSIYTELNMPIIAPKTRVPLVRSLDLQLSNRTEFYSVSTGTAGANVSPNQTPPAINYYGYTDSNGNPVHYRTSYTNSTRTAGLKYKPVDDVIFRASFSQAFLPPTYSQLLPNPVPSEPSTTPIYDRKTNSTYDGYITTGGGNPNLVPQHTKNWNLGLIYEPERSFLKGLRFDVEYYKITQLGVITGLTEQQTIDDPDYASRVTRDPNTGLITKIDLSLVNGAKYETSGFDYSVSYRKATSVGTFDLYLLYSVIEHLKQQLGYQGPLLEYVGYANSGGAAKSKGNVTLAWENDRWNLAWTSTYFGGYKQLGAPNDPNFYDTAFVPPVLIAQGATTIPSQLYHQFVAGYSFGKRAGGQGRWTRASNQLLSNVSIQVGVKNVFNTRPPFDAARQPYYYSSYGDIRLRDYWISVRKSF